MRRLLMGGFLLVASTCASASVQLAVYVVGEAFNNAGDTLLYREVHRCDEARTQCVIDYVSPVEVAIARKVVDYRGSASAPKVELENLLLDSRNAAVGNAADRDLVVDAGFDNYVRSRWSELDDGQSISFPFLVLGREDPLPMRAVRREGECAEGGLCLEVAPDAWYLRLLVPPIVLTYDRETRRLLRYQGISNLRDDQGNNRQVDIRYRYSADFTASQFSASQPSVAAP